MTNQICPCLRCSRLSLLYPIGVYGAEICSEHSLK